MVEVSLIVLTLAVFTVGAAGVAVGWRAGAKKEHDKYVGLEIENQSLMRYSQMLLEELGWKNESEKTA
jgi:hypothetical protein